MTSPPDDRVTEIQRRTLEGLSSAAKYRRWICDLAEPWLGDVPIEVGAGTGDYAREWRQPGRHLTVAEHDPVLVDHLRETLTDDDVAVASLSLPTQERANHSAAVAINVLEHVEDDVEALTSMARLCRAGGHVIVFVPAFPSLMSQFDHEVGHHRRYRRRSLHQAMTAAGLEVVDLHHVNLIGLPAWWLLIRVLGQRPGEGFALRVFECLVPFLRRLEAWRRPPFGQSLFAVGRKVSTHPGP